MLYGRVRPCTESSAFEAPDIQPVSPSAQVAVPVAAGQAACTAQDLHSARRSQTPPRAAVWVAGRGPHQPNQPPASEVKGGSRAACKTNMPVRDPVFHILGCSNMMSGTCRCQCCKACTHVLKQITQHEMQLHSNGIISKLPPSVVGKLLKSFLCLDLGNISRMLMYVHATTFGHVRGHESASKFLTYMLQVTQRSACMQLLDSDLDLYMQMCFAKEHQYGSHSGHHESSRFKRNQCFICKQNQPLCSTHCKQSAVTCNVPQKAGKYPLQ